MPFRLGRRVSRRFSGLAGTLPVPTITEGDQRSHPKGNPGRRQQVLFQGGCEKKLPFPSYCPLVSYVVRRRFLSPKMGVLRGPFLTLPGSSAASCSFLPNGPGSRSRPISDPKSDDFAHGLAMSYYRSVKWRTALRANDRRPEKAGERCSWYTVPCRCRRLPSCNDRCRRARVGC